MSWLKAFKLALGLLAFLIAMSLFVGLLVGFIMIAPPLVSIPISILAVLLSITVLIKKAAS